MLWGAIAQSFPDIDFLASFWMSTSKNLLAHRGFTHSLLFVAVTSVLLALIFERWHRPHNITLRKWLLFFSIQGCVHVFIDAFNNYGVGWLEPFSNYRFSFNALYVADPFFSIWPAVVLIVLLILPKTHRYRMLFWLTGVLSCCAYLLYAVSNKIYIDREVRTILKERHVSYDSYFTTPTPLNNWLWYVVAGNDSGFWVGFRSVFDAQKDMDLYFFPRNDSILNRVDDHRAVQELKRFSKGFYTVQQQGDTIIFNDLRFGQIIGWERPDEQFVFHYYLTHPADNELVVQRGRFAKWNKETPLFLLRRIRGN